MLEYVHLDFRGAGDDIAKLPELLRPQ